MRNMLRRANASEDGRGVVVALIEAGIARLTETAQAHLRGVSQLFVERLNDQETRGTRHRSQKKSSSTARSAEDTAPAWGQDEDPAPAPSIGRRASP